MTKKRKQKVAVDNNKGIEEIETTVGISSQNSNESNEKVNSFEQIDDSMGLVPKKKRKKNETPRVISNENAITSESSDVENVKQKKKSKVTSKLDSNEEGVIKKLKKHKVDSSATEDSQDSQDDGTDQMIKTKKKKLTDKGDPVENGIELNIGDSVISQSVETIPQSSQENAGEVSWPEEDLNELINRIERCIPSDDHLSYKTRLLRIEWEQVAFKNYSITDCQNTWSRLERNIRSYRLLKEMLSDARSLVVNYGTVANTNSKVYKSRILQMVHPDMPRRPLTPYFLFYVKKKNKVQKEHPGLDGVELTKLIGQMFKNLSPEKREKYEKMAMKNKEEYKIKLEEFYQNHPEISRTANIKIPKASKGRKPLKDKVPKRPDAPFKLFFKAELSKSNIPEGSMVTFRETCREMWREMSDKQKLGWINYAEEEYAKYEELLKNFMENHPNYVHVEEKRSFLSRDEILIKDRLAGKPDKPPVSAYAVYAKLVFNKEELKGVHAKDRLNFISNKWKLLSDNEKQDVKNLHSQMVDQYQKDFMRYVASLPEDKRKIELQNFSGKKSTEDSDASPKKQKAKPKEIKLQEPEQPPISPFKYFASLYKGEVAVAEAWKALSVEEKQKYEQELVQKKQEYILEFEKFLKSLTKDELETFSNLRKQKIEMRNENEVEGGSTESDSDFEESDDTD